MNVNITAAVILSQWFLPSMIEHGSGIVMTVGSASAHSDLNGCPFSKTATDRTSH
jgi:short-subunit dehydrogenase